MSDVSALLERIDAEFSTLEGKIKRAQDERLQEHQDRQKRLTTFKRELDSLSEVWGPRLEALIERFGDYVKVAPRLESTSRAATLDFDADLARLHLRLSATTDHDVRNLVLTYDLEMSARPHAVRCVSAGPVAPRCHRPTGDWELGQ